MTPPTSRPRPGGGAPPHAANAILTQHDATILNEPGA